MSPGRGRGQGSGRRWAAHGGGPWVLDLRACKPETPPAGRRDRGRGLPGSRGKGRDPAGVWTQRRVSGRRGPLRPRARPRPAPLCAPAHIAGPQASRRLEKVTGSPRRAGADSTTGEREAGCEEGREPSCDPSRPSAGPLPGRLGVPAREGGRRPAGGIQAAPPGAQLPGNRWPARAGGTRRWWEQGFLGGGDSAFELEGGDGWAL